MPEQPSMEVSIRNDEENEEAAMNVGLDAIGVWAHKGEQSVLN